MATNERTSQKVARIASKALRDPESVKPEEVQMLAGSVLTQASDKKPRQQRRKP